MKSFPRTEQDTCSKRPSWACQLIGYIAILIPHDLSSSFPNDNPGYCSCYCHRSKDRRPIFICKLSTKFENSYLPDSIPLFTESQLESDYTGCVRGWRVTDEQVRQLLFSRSPRSCGGDRHQKQKQASRANT